tara:strand:+ start:82 stop:489 length:408 start_codon:yes stop_codon:yes gene_type:complete
MPARNRAIYLIAGSLNTFIIMSFIKDVKVGYQALGSLLKESGEFRKDYAMGIIDIPIAVTKAAVDIIDTKVGSTQRRYNIANAVNERMLEKYGDEISQVNKDIRSMMKDLMASRVSKSYNTNDSKTTEYTEFTMA